MSPPDSFAHTIRDCSSATPFHLPTIPRLPHRRGGTGFCTSFGPTISSPWRSSRRCSGTRCRVIPGSRRSCCWSELPGILNWALDGIARLREQRHFTEPSSSREAIRDLEDLASPISAFVRDRCRVAPDQAVGIDHLWAAWKGWCDDQSQRPGTKQTFGRDLRAAVPRLGVSRPRQGEHLRV